MIWESRYWKADLLRFADQLGRARTTASPSSSKTYVSVEKAVLMGALVVRRLVDSHKLSDATAGMLLRVNRMPPTGKRVTLFNNHRLEELFDFSRSVRCQQALPFLCNRIMPRAPTRSPRSVGDDARNAGVRSKVPRIRTARDRAARGGSDLELPSRDMVDAACGCKANCEAWNRGFGGRESAEFISESRELLDEYITRDPPAACNADRAANRFGRSPSASRQTTCAPPRPPGLDPRY